ncbi:cytochrome P450 2J2-like [Paramacrobiotus metropolitanus]|uniref:cytochrome P450 2J2-like n=1 Tax=Paramacrobiotus metropolitanus TaxID=2943436 RepID=UPI0024460F52|nr:cytochrome P450 2J2-like [Paramacrobiotus metropolitanus]
MEEAHPIPGWTVSDAAKTGLFLLVLGLFIRRFFLRRPRLPPGPFAFPIFGALPLVDARNPLETFRQWAKQYGKMYFIKMGANNVIMLNDAELVREAFSGDVCNYRPQHIGVRKRKKESGGGCGIIFADGLLWKEHRRFLLRTFRDLGVGRRSIEDKIKQEADYLLTIVRDGQGQPMDTTLPAKTVVGNVITSIVSSDRYLIDDPNKEFAELVEKADRMFKISFESVMIESYEWLWWIPPFTKEYKILTGCFEYIRDYFVKKVQKHRKEWREGEERDLMDTYMTSMKNKEHATFSEKQLGYLGDDLMLAGHETTATTLRWGLLYMCLYPDIQKKVQVELDGIMAPGSTIVPSDQLNMPYTEAVLTELSRIGSIVPFGVMHMAEKDTTLAGYDIPQGTWIMPNLHYIHHDDTLWENPNEFIPERFLTSDGKTLKCPDYLIPFSVGKRRCPGEGLARTEIVSLFTGVLRNFDLRVEHPERISRIPIMGHTLEPQHHHIIATPR